MDKTPALADALFDEIAAGVSITAACASQGFDRKEFYRWQAADEAFATRIARAREIGVVARIDENQDIADGATAEDWQVARLRIWERQWAASKINPKKYGDRLQAEVTGADGGPLVVQWKKPDA